MTQKYPFANQCWVIWAALSSNQDHEGLGYVFGQLQEIGSISLFYVDQNYKFCRCLLVFQIYCSQQFYQYCMSQHIELEPITNRQLTQPAEPQPITTEIFDSKLPSQLNFKLDQSGKPAPSPSTGTELDLNPEKPEDFPVVLLNEYRVVGKSIIDVGSNHRLGMPLNSQAHRFKVKSFDEASKGLIKLWEAVVGYSRRQLVIEDGHLHILNSSTLIQSVRLVQLLKFFIDIQQYTIRLVLRGDEGSNKLIHKDFQFENREGLKALLDKIVLECNAIGLDILQTSL